MISSSLSFFFFFFFFFFLHFILIFSFSFLSVYDNSPLMISISILGYLETIDLI